ncbi:MAG: potassium channel family protein [Actinomycetota bacterium]|nr:potassium channel family protein [Actinomycetota bacterium]
MNWVLVATGVALLGLTTIDLIATVVTPGLGRGIFASRVADVAWRVALWGHERSPNHRLLGAIGVVLVVSVPGMWMAALWAGWTAIFSSSDQAVLVASTGVPADGWSRVYFAGYDLFTSGLGDMVPGGSVWQVLTVLDTAMGLGMVTLAVTYLVPVVQAATGRRQLARQIAHAGCSAPELLRRCWSPPEVTWISDNAQSITGQLQTVTEQHLTYPVLHFLHSTDPYTSLGPRTAALYDAAIAARELGAGPGERLALDLLLDAIDDLVSSVGHPSVPRGGTTPPVPDIDVRRDETVDPDPDRDGTVAGGDGRLAAAYDERAEQRRGLDALLRHDGWTWESVDGALVPGEDGRSRTT